MTLLTKPLTRAIALLILIGAGVGSANAQADRTTVGTLTCLLGAGTIEELREPRSLSCTFVSPNGADVEYSGTIRNLADPVPTSDQLVLVWTVVSSNKTMPGNMLMGRYTGEIESSFGAEIAPEGSLIGGQDGSVKLIPLTPIPGIKPRGSFVGVELTLEKTLV